MMKRVLGSVRSLFSRGRMESDLDEELRFHVERQTEENVRRGLSPEEARAEALRRFGGVEKVKEECRDADRAVLLETILQDMRYGARSLRESFVDEIAAALKRDPLALRLELLGGDPVLALPPWRIDRARLRAVLELAARQSQWGTPPPVVPGRRSGRGIACNVYHGETVLAHVAEVSVGPTGDVRVHRIVTAADCGQVVNRSGVEAQVEGGVAWGLSYALKGEITIRNGRVAETSYGDYPVLDISEMPKVEVHMVENDAAPSGFGEQPVAPAVANAIFAATGKRVRRLPIRPGDLA